VCRLLPESVVWLCANNRVHEAERIIQNAARLNNITLPKNILSGKSTDEDKVDDYEEQPKDKKNMFGKFSNLAQLRRGQRKKEVKDARYTLLDVFRHLRLALYCVCMAFLWSVGSTDYTHHFKISHCTIELPAGFVRSTTCRLHRGDFFSRFFTA